jgi:hypothetical protein
LIRAFSGEVDTGSPQKMRPSKEIEHFQEKWNPVFRPKVRAKKAGAVSCFHET